MWQSSVAMNYLNSEAVTQLDVMYPLFALHPCDLPLQITQWVSSI